jgi:hypothetical protein
MIISRAAGSILFIEFSYRPCVQPQTVSGWSSYRQTKTPNRQFFLARFRALRVDDSFLEISAKSSLVRRYVFCSHGFSGLQDLLSIELSYEPEKQPRKLPDGRVVGSPKLKIVIFGEFAIEIQGLR